MEIKKNVSKVAEKVKMLGEQLNITLNPPLVIKQNLYPVTIAELKNSEELNNQCAIENKYKKTVGDGILTK